MVNIQVDVKPRRHSIGLRVSDQDLETIKKLAKSYNTTVTHATYLFLHSNLQTLRRRRNTKKRVKV